MVANLEVATHQLRISMAQNGLLSYSASLTEGTINLHNLEKEDLAISIQKSISKSRNKHAKLENGIDEIECKNQLVVNKNYPIAKIRFNKDGTLLLTTSSHQNKIKVYDVTDKKLILTLMPSVSSG